MPLKNVQNLAYLPVEFRKTARFLIFKFNVQKKRKTRCFMELNGQKPY